MAGTPTPVTFQPLPERHFRLLELSLGGCEHQRSISTIHPFSIDAVPSYHALSYTWGTKTADRLISLDDGTNLPATLSLETALPYVLKQCKAQFLFVDQLCIDQKNMRERSAQVALMQKIFKQAESVIIWLGPSIPHQGVLCWLLDELRDEGRLSAFRKITVSRIYLYLGSDNFKKVRKDMELDKAEKVIIKTLVEIFQLPWFCRIWIIQEAVLPSHAFFVLGSLKFSPLGLYEILAIACKRRMRESPELINELPGYRAFLYLMELADKNGRFLQPFKKILANHRTSVVRGSFRATDTRDYVYGILGLGAYNENESLNRPKLIPDLNLRTVEVFAEAARWMANEDGKLDVLNLCDRVNESQNVLDPHIKLPSWAPDWSNRRKTKFEINPLDVKLEFSAAGDRRFADEKVVGFRPVSLELSLQGKTITRVYAVYTNCLDTLRSIFFNTIPEPRSLLKGRTWLEAGDVCLPLERFSSYPPDLLFRLFNVMLYWALRDMPDVTGEKTSYVAKFLRWIYSETDVLENFTCEHSSPCRNCEIHVREGTMDKFEVDLYDIVYKDLHKSQDDAEFFMADSGALGIAQGGLAEKDVIAILHGYDVPAVLRPTSEGKYEYITGCYLENAMYGQKMIWAEHEADSIVLV